MQSKVIGTRAPIRLRRRMAHAKFLDARAHDADPTRIDQRRADGRGTTRNDEKRQVHPGTWAGTRHPNLLCAEVAPLVSDTVLYLTLPDPLRVPGGSCLLTAFRHSAAPQPSVSLAVPRPLTLLRRGYRLPDVCSSTRCMQPKSKSNPRHNTMLESPKRYTQGLARRPCTSCIPTHA